MVSPGIHADVDGDGALIGLEVLDASDVLQDNLQFEVDVNRSNDGEGPTSAK